MKKRMAILFVGTMLCLLTGCGSSITSEVSSIAVDKEGTVEHIIVGELEQPYYDLSELEQMTNERVAEYTDSYGKDSVRLNSIKGQNDSRVVISISYDNIRDYTGFNHRDLYCGPVTEAKTRGYRIENIAFMSREGEPIEPASIDNLDSLNVAIIETAAKESLLVKLTGKILCVSQNSVQEVTADFEGKTRVLIKNNLSEEKNEKTYSYVIYE